MSGIQKLMGCITGLIFSVACMGGTAVSAKSTSGLRINKSSRSAVTVIESVLAGTTTPVMNVFSGAVGVTGQGMAMMPSQNTNSSSSQISTLPAVAVLSLSDGAATKDQILAAAKINLLPTASQVATSLKLLMTSQQYKTANFIFEQSIKPAGVSGYVKVVWQVTVLEGGRVIYADPRVTDPDPIYVYVGYVSKQVAAGLPSSWGYADGGKLKWQLVKKDGTPLTAMTTMDVAGAFDVPSVPDATGYDPDWGVKCLADITSSASCPVLSGFRDVNALIAANSASGSIIDYGRKLEPVYIDKGDGTQQASTTVSFDTRSVTYSTCNVGTLRTAGRYGFTLKTTFDRFSYNAQSVPTLLSRSNSNTYSPTQLFDYSVPTSLRSSQIGDQVINPFDPNGALVSAGNFQNVAYLAPLTVGDTGGQSIQLVDYGQGGGRGYTGESINVSTAMSGNTFILSMSTPWIEGYDDGRVIRDTYIKLNIPLCRIESAYVTASGAVQGQVIFANGTAVSATDGVGFQTSLWDPNAPGGCDDSGCYSGGPLVVWNQPMVQYVTQPFSWGQLLRNSNAYWHSNSYVPISFKSKLVDGTNTFLFQHLTFHGSTSAAEIRFNLAPY